MGSLVPFKYTTSLTVKEGPNSLGITDNMVRLGVWLG